MEELEINKADYELRTNNNSQDTFGSLNEPKPANSMVLLYCNYIMVQYMII